LTDFSYCLWKAVRATLVIFVLHLEIHQPPLETGEQHIQPLGKQGCQQLWCETDSYRSKNFIKPASGNYKPASVNTSRLPEKKKIGSVYCGLLKHFKRPVQKRERKIFSCFMKIFGFCGYKINKHHP
jgi:hypothetical protein